MDLVKAAAEGDRVAVEAKLAQGVDVNSKDADGRTALSWAAGNGHEKVVQVVMKYLGNRIVVDSCDSYGRTPLLWAARNGHDDVAETLLRKGEYRVDINAQDHNGLSPLLQAVKHGHSTVVQHLLDRTSIDLNITDALGQTALHYAARSNHSVILKALLAHRYQEVSVDARDRGGITPLEKAVRHKATQSIQYLLQASASTEGIARDDWLAAFCEPTASIVLLSEVPSGSKSLRFIAEESLPTSLSSSAHTRHLL